MGTTPSAGQGRARHDLVMTIGWPEIVGSAAVVALVGFAGLQLARLPKVWRGERLLTLPWPNFHGPEVNHRSFPVFTGFITLLGGGSALVWISVIADWAGVVVPGGLAIVFAVFVFVPLWILINAVNRPRLLVPPARRAEPGWWGRRRARRRRQQSGLPPTEHVVEVLDVRPLPGDRHQYDPYFVAVCSADDCDWTSAPIGRDEAHPDPEGSVREEARSHSSTITGPQRPLG